MSMLASGICPASATGGVSHDAIDIGMNWDYVATGKRARARREPSPISFWSAVLSAAVGPGKGWHRCSRRPATASTVRR